MLEEFFDTLKEEFGDPDQKATQIHKLRTIQQGNRTADEHVLAFKKIARSSGYTRDALTELLKWKALQEDLQPRQ